jgi:hypothetical protein
MLMTTNARILSLAFNTAHFCAQWQVGRDGKNIELRRWSTGAERQKYASSVAHFSAFST